MQLGFKSTSARNLFDQMNAVRQSVNHTGAGNTEATASTHILGNHGADSELQRLTKMSHHKYEPPILRSQQQIRSNKKGGVGGPGDNKSSVHQRLETPQSTAFDS